MLPLENITIGGLLRRTALRFPDRPAMEHLGRVWSYAAFDRAVDETARRLLALGVGKGERVGIWCEAEPAAVRLFYAVTRIGAAAVLLNTGLSREELKELLAGTDTAWLGVGDGYKKLDYPALCRGLTKELPNIKRAFYIGEQNCESLSALPEGLAPEETLRAAEEAVTPEDTASILFTSGTTSRPKAVMSSHYSRANSGIQQAHDLGASEHDRFCAALPLFHCFSLTVNVMAACAAGACLYLPASRRTQSILSAVQEGKCTVLSCVPTLFHALIRREDLGEWDVSSLRTGFIGGSLYPAELFREIEEKLGFTLLSSLGQTEATAGLTTVSLDDPLEVRAKTMGHFMAHVEGKIADIRTGEPLPTCVSGEICIRGYNVMQGYFGQPEETVRVIDGEGWLHTGDMGYLDEEENLHLTGRLKELIIRGGENISPAEIEDVLAEEERVEACKAVGVPDEHYGEEVCLCVKLKEGASFPEGELREHLAARLAEFKRPKYLLYLDSLPITASGKVNIQELKRLVRKELGDEKLSL